MNWFRQERDKLRQLPRRQRLTYIWDYYRLWILGLVALVAISAYMIGNFIHANRDNQIYVVYANTFTDLGENSDFWEGYVSFSSADTSKENVIFDDENYFDMSKSSVTRNYYYEKVVVLIDSETMDAIVFETENLALLGQSGRLMDLNDERTRALMEKYADRLITVTHEDEDGTSREIPVGFDISDSRLVTEEGAYSGECALGISASAQHIDAVEQLLDYLLQGA